ncbi:MAG: histidine phosphatase family protein [Chthoniobacteraceae bacterium]
MKTHPSDQILRLYLIRHGEVEDGYQRVFAGSRVDMALSPLGHQQAAALADWFADRKVDAVFASPMLRVRQTMAPLLGRRGVKPTLLDGLREVDFGDWTGFRWEEVRERFGVSAPNWLHMLDDPGLPNGESAATLLARVRPCVDQVLGEITSGSAVIFCHGGIVRAILAILLDMRLPEIGSFRLDYGSVTAVELRADVKRVAEIELLNFCPPDGLRTR